MKEQIFLRYISVTPFVSLAFGAMITSSFINERSSYYNIALAAILTVFVISFLAISFFKAKKSGVLSREIYVGFISAIMIVMIQGLLSAYLWINTVTWISLVYAILPLTGNITSVGKRNTDVIHFTRYTWSSHHIICIMIMWGLIRLM